MLYISDRLVVDDASIVEVVAFFFVKVAEELEQVFRTADTEPEGGYNTDDTDNEETLDEEVVSSEAIPTIPPVYDAPVTEAFTR